MAGKEVIQTTAAAFFPKNRNKVRPFSRNITTKFSHFPETNPSEIACMTL